VEGKIEVCAPCTSQVARSPARSPGCAPLVVGARHPTIRPFLCPATTTAALQLQHFHQSKASATLNTKHEHEGSRHSLTSSFLPPRPNHQPLFSSTPLPYTCVHLAFGPPITRSFVLFSWVASSKGPPIFSAPFITRRPRPLGPHFWLETRCIQLISKRSRLPGTLLFPRLHLHEIPRSNHWTLQRQLPSRARCLECSTCALLCSSSPSSASRLCLLLRVNKPVPMESQTPSRRRGSASRNCLIRLSPAPSTRSCILT